MAFWGKLAFWIFMLAMALLCPAVMIVFGRRFKDDPPQKVNSVFGYRTRRSMKNRETWNYAHSCFGTLWLRCGIVMLPASIVVMLFSISNEINFIGYYGMGVVLIQLIIMLIPIFIVEAKLKQTFDDNGRKK